MIELFKKTVVFAALAFLNGCATCGWPEYPPSPKQVASTVDTVDFFLKISGWIVKVGTCGYQALELEHDLSPDCKRFLNNLSDLHCGADPAIILVNETVLVPGPNDNVPRSHLAFRDDPDDRTNLAFITGAVSSLGGDHLMFMSSVGPNHMTIVAIGPDLRCRLVYDNFYKNDLTDMNTCLDPVGSVQWVADNQFLMTERTDLSQSRCGSGRTFQLTINANGTVVIAGRASNN